MGYRKEARIGPKLDDVSLYVLKFDPNLFLIN